MKKREKSKLDMQETILKILDNHVSVWSHFEPMGDEVDALRAITTGTAGDAKTQVDTSSKGFTKQKRTAYTVMVNEAHQTAVKLKLWAKKKGNDLVFSVADISLWQLKNMADQDKLNYCKAILSKAEENLAALASFKVSADTNERLRKSITAAQAYRTDWNVAGATHKQVTGNINTGVQTAADIFANLDDYIKLFTDEKEAAFVNEYRAGRKLKYYKNASPKKTPVSKKEDKA